MERPSIRPRLIRARALPLQLVIGASHPTYPNYDIRRRNRVPLLLHFSGLVGAFQGLVCGGPKRTGESSVAFPTVWFREHALSEPPTELVLHACPVHPSELQQ